MRYLTHVPHDWNSVRHAAADRIRQAVNGRQRLLTHCGHGPVAPADRDRDDYPGTLFTRSAACATDMLNGMRGTL